MNGINDLPEVESGSGQCGRVTVVSSVVVVEFCAGMVVGFLVVAILVLVAVTVVDFPVVVVGFSVLVLGFGEVVVTVEVFRVVVVDF